MKTSLFYKLSGGVLLALILQFAPFSCRAQLYFPPLPDNRQVSVGAGVGLTDLWGDVGTASFINRYRSPLYRENLRCMATLQLKYSFNAWLAGRFSYSYGKLYSSDGLNKFLADKDPGAQNTDWQRWMRNLDVETKISEGALVFELNPFRAFDISRRVARMRIQPVLLAGVGYFSFNPYGTYRDFDGSTSKIKLRELHTEGQGLKGSGNTDGLYSLRQFNFPLGAGLRVQLSDQLSLNLEYLYRYCSTDYLDDVSGRYVNPAVFDNNMTARDASIAKVMADKTVLIDPKLAHGSGDLRGSAASKDGYSTFGITLYYAFLNTDYTHAFFRNGRTRKYGERLW